MLSLKRIGLLISLSSTISAFPAQAETNQLAKSTLTINGQPLIVEVARTFNQRQQGLMFRKELGEGQGMLFDFNEDVIPCFWMKNTSIPLSIAYINSQFQITQISPLEPQDLTPICSKASIRYAIEVPQGWFAQQGIVQGMQVKGIDHP